MSAKTLLKPDASDGAHDVLVPDDQVARELGNCSKMKIWRMDHDPATIELGWPARVELNRRNFRSRRQLEIFKSNLLKRALTDRTARLARRRGTEA
jgi:hypothetical protein